MIILNDNKTATKKIIRNYLKHKIKKKVELFI